ncbi:MAG: hypothetical protein AAFV53_39070 [Myxococcota bacterium]
MSADSPLDAKKLGAVDKFLGRVDQRTLFDYFDVDQHATVDEIQNAIKKRRSWAQGQQSNPKYREEAMWVIKNKALVADVLITHRDAYLEHLHAISSAQSLKTLRLFIQGAIADKVLTAASEEAIIEQGLTMDLTIDQIRQTIEALLDEKGARRTRKGLASAPTIALPRDQFSIPDEEEEEASIIPPPPQGVRSFQPGQAEERSPKLVLDGPKKISLRVGNRPVTVSLTVRNAGQGRMTGRIHADRPWVRPEPARLDPARNQQTIRLTVDPHQMSRRRGQCRVTIATRGAGNQSMMIEVQRRSYAMPLLAGGLVLIGLAGFGISRFSTNPSVPDVGRLVINVDPAVGSLFLDDQLQSTQGRLDLDQTEGLKLNEPMNLRIEADGFAVWNQTITVPAGQTVVVRPELELTDEMNLTLQEGWIEGTLDDGVIQSAIQTQQVGFNRCFVDYLNAAPGDVKFIQIRAYVDQIGDVKRIDFGEDNIDSSPLEYCLRRQFRALQLPILNARYDYAVFEHIFRYTVPPPGPEDAP